MSDLLWIALSALLINNLVLTYFLGICPFLGVSRHLSTAFGMGVAVTFVTTVAGMLTFLLERHLLEPLGLAYLQYLVFIFVIAGTVQLVELYVQRFHGALHQAFGVFLPMITTNCAILGVCLLIQLKGYDTLAQAAVFSLCGGLGFTLALLLMAGIRERLEGADVPAPFQGVALALICAGILALAFMGFAGMGAS